MTVTPERVGPLAPHLARDVRRTRCGIVTGPRRADLASTAPAFRAAQVLAVGGLTGPAGLRRMLARLAAVPGVRSVVADFGTVEVTPVLVAYADVPQSARALAKSAVRAEVLRYGLTINTPARHG